MGERGFEHLMSPFETSRGANWATRLLAQQSNAFMQITFGFKSQYHLADLKPWSHPPLCFYKGRRCHLSETSLMHLSKSYTTITYECNNKKREKRKKRGGGGLGNKTKQKERKLKYKIVPPGLWTSILNLTMLF